MGAGAWERRAAADAAARNREREESLRAERARRQNALQLEKDTVTRAGLRKQAEARVAQAQRERERRELEAAQRAQAEARTNFAQSQREFEALSAAESAFPTQNLFEQPSGLPENLLDFYSRRTERQQNQAAMRDFWEYVAYGPERRSVFGDGDAGKGERFARDWGASEQEIREGVERLGEGRVVSGAGFLGLGVLGVGANVGDVRRLGYRLGRASRFLPGAADVGRAAENLRAATIARATPEQISSVSSVGPLPNRAKEAVTQQSRTLDSLRETQLSTMHRLTPDDLEELRRASPAVRQMSPDNIWVIHETSFPPSRSGSDIVLRPTADYVSETGRHSVHFSLNHSAAGHELRQGAGSRYVVAARLSDVLEANPGSLDNLYSVDTFFTPRPGEGLRIPNATVLEDAQSVSTQQAIRNLIEESGGVAIAGGPRYSPITGVDVRIRQLAEELKVPSMTHDGHPLFSFESNFLNGFGNADPNFYLPLMSDNARLRVSGENVWTHPSMDSLRRSRFVDPDV